MLRRNAGDWHLQSDPLRKILISDSIHSILHVYVYVFSELQAASLQQQSFEQRCESWLAFLQHMEDSLAVEIASTYPGLREQQRTHQVQHLTLP